MAPLGPFAGDRRIAVAVSGGADSMTLALLLRGWGRPFALVVDHGLRPASAVEAGMTLQRLAAMGIPARLLQADLRHGPALAERARAARYALLGAACRDAGLVDLALGHHLRDQAETVLLRRAAGSGAAGLSGMSAVAHTDAVRLLRPLLKVPPARLRATLAAAGVEWVEDPTNADPATPRARLRAGPLADPAAALPLGAEAAASGVARAAMEARTAAELAAFVTVGPEGIAHIRAPIGPQAVSALAWTLSGGAHPPPLAAVARLSERLHGAPGWAGTLHGVCVVPAGGFGPGWLMGREAVAMQDAVPADRRWDGRFQVSPPLAPADGGDGTTLGALGPDAARLRRWSALPSALLRTLPTLRRDGAIVAVPHLRYPGAAACCGAAVVFRPARPVAPAAFFAA